MLSVSSSVQPAGGNPYNEPAVGTLTNMIFQGGNGYYLSKKAFESSDALSLSGAASGQSVNQALLKFSLAAGVGAGLVYGVVGLGKQLNAVNAGGQDMAGAMANVTADALYGLSAGITAGGLGSLTALGMRAIGATGFIGTAATVVSATIGGLIGEVAFGLSGVREKLISAYGSQKTGPLPEPGY